MANNIPNKEKLQEFLNNTPEDSFLFNQVISTLENLKNIDTVFLKNPSYLPLLEVAYPNSKTFKNLTNQIRKQCERLSEKPKFKP